MYDKIFINKYIELNILIIIILFLVTIVILTILSNKFNKINKKILILSFLYHTAISIIYYNWIPLHISSDPVNYYITTINSNSWLSLYGYGGTFVEFILYPLIKYVKLNFFTSFMFFNIIGYFGIVLIYIAISENISNNKRAKTLLMIALFFPGLNWWTSMIGKDAFALLSLSMIMLSLNNIKRRKLLLIIGLVLVAHIRPHIFLCVSTALLLVTISLTGINIAVRITFSIIICVFLIIGSYMFMEHARLEVLDLETAEKFIESRESWGGGSSVDIGNYNIVFKILTFLFRPLFFDAKNIYMLLSSFENVIYVLIFLNIFNIKFIKYIYNNTSIFVKYNLYYFIVTTLIFALTTPNLGTAVRHKNMIMISLFSVIILYFDKRKNNGKKIKVDKDEITTLNKL
jgi:hypothetical protein